MSQQITSFFLCKQTESTEDSDGDSGPTNNKRQPGPDNNNNNIELITYKKN